MEFALSWLWDSKQAVATTANKSAVPENLPVASAAGQETELSQVAWFAGSIYLADG